MLVQGVAMEPREPTPEPRGVLQNLFSPMFQLFQPGQEAEADQNGPHPLVHSEPLPPQSRRCSMPVFTPHAMAPQGTIPGEERGGSLFMLLRLRHYVGQTAFFSFYLH